jgi:hypothetical protein
LTCLMHVNQSNTWSVSLFIESEFKVTIRWEKIAVKQSIKETTKIQKKDKIWTGLTAQKLENTREEKQK